MTCIVGLEHDHKVYMGGDSAAVGDWDIQETDEHKVFRSGDFLIGYTSSFRMGQLLRYSLDIPKNSNSILGDMKYMVTEFIPAVRNCLKEGSFTKIENSKEEGGIFLVGYHGLIYRIDSDFQVLRIRSDFTSVGHGFAFALGAMAVMEPS